MISSIILSINLTVTGLFAAALIWSMLRSMRQSPGPAPWPLRLVVDATGTLRFGFLWAMVGTVLVYVLILVFADVPVSPRQQQLDRIEQRLRELADKQAP